MPPAGNEPRITKKAKRRIVAGACAILAVAAAYALSRPPPPAQDVVSGRAGVKKTKSGQSERWFHSRTTIVLDGSLDKLSPGTRDAVTEAFGTWLSADAKLPHLSFDSRKAEPLKLSPDGENRVYYAPITLPGHENDLAVTVGYTNQSTGEIVEADIIVNSKHPFALLEAVPASAGKDGSSKGHGSSDDHDDSSASAGTGTAASALTVPGCTDTYDLASVVTHEAGHFFGLGEDMKDTTTTMYYSTKPCDVHKRVLKADDTGEVSTLYESTPEGASEEDGTASAQKCSISVSGLGRRGAGTSLAPFGTLLLAAAALRRRQARGAATS